MTRSFFFGPACPGCGIFHRRLFAILLLLFLGGWLTPPVGAAPASPAPTLSISVQGPNAAISWTGANYWLQEAIVAETPMPWFNSPWPVTNVGNLYTALVPLASEQACYFRLVASSFLPPPADLMVDPSDDSIGLDWNPVTNAVAYNVYISTNPAVSTRIFDTELTMVPGPPLFLYDLTPGVTYYFVATAVDDEGNESADSNIGSATFGPYGTAQGWVYTEFINDSGTNDIDVPNITMSLKNPTNNMVVAQAETDDEGYFQMLNVPSGTYEVCWGPCPGYMPSCDPQWITVGEDTTNVVEVISPETNASNGMVYGTITLTDGSPAAPFVDINGNSIPTTVTLKSPAKGALLGSTTANEDGFYIFPSVPMGTNLILTAVQGAAVTTTNINTSQVGEVDLVLPDSLPVIQTLYITYNGQRVTHAPPGATVQVTVQAISPSGYPLHYAWSSSENTPGPMAIDAATTTMTLETNDGQFGEVSVEVTDDYGGFADAQTEFNIENEVTVSGYVDGCSATNAGTLLVLTNADIEVNGTPTTTDTNGFFTVTLPASSATNFNLSISAPGYASMYDTASDNDVSETYVLKPLSSACLFWTGSETNFIVDPSGSGAAIQLQANSLYTSSNTSYTGPICVAFTAYDPCSMSNVPPANNTAVDGFGNPLYLLPQAMLSVLITDDNGNPLSLGPGLAATVIMPPGETCEPITNAPEIVPDWVWDSTNNVWRTNGMVTNFGNGGPFQGPARQLGLLAAGEAPAQGTIDVSLDATVNATVEFRLSSRPGKLLLITDGPLLNEAVPLGVPVTLQLLSPKQAPGDYYTDPSTPATFVPPANKTIISQKTYTFTEASTPVVISLSTQIADLDPSRVNKRTSFLAFRSGQVISTDPFNTVDEYYRAIGFPRSDANNDLTGWLIKHNFLTARVNGVYSEDAGALFFNATDLGFARSMHMKTTMAKDKKMDVAFYVVNYNTLEDALAQARDVATVAMDYALDNNGKRIMKFYVFDTSNKGYALRPFADLLRNDNAMIVPNLCITCHGGKPAKYKLNAGSWTVTPANGDLGSMFIPFDIQSFTYTGKTIKDNRSGKMMGGVQTAQFKSMNAAIFQYTPMTDATSELISGWYGGALNNANNNGFSPTFVPNGWANTKAIPNATTIYSAAFQIACRGCHVMRPDYAFNTLAELTDPTTVKKSIKTVCVDLSMPNSQRAFTIFWGSKCANFIKNGSTPSMPDLMGTAFGWGPCPAPVKK